MKQTFQGKWVFIILPLYYLTLSIIFISGIKQYYLNHFDPSYIYLMNGINLASGHFRVGIIEHPGTPVECFAGLVIFIKHLFSENTLLYQDVLLHPESYAFTCSAVLALLFSLVTYFAGSYVFRHSGNTLMALLFQTAPLFFHEIVRRTVLLSAESFITIYGIFFMAYLYVNTIGRNPIPGKTTTNKNVILFGLFTALLITTKIYCAPVILLVLFMLRNGKQRILYLALAGVFSLLLLFPLYNQLIWVAVWFKSVIFHVGFYGNGEPGIINTALYKSSIIDIFTNHYLFAFVFSIILAAFLTALWGRLKPLNTPMEKNRFQNFLFPVTGVLIFFIVFILIIAKHYTYTYYSPAHQVLTRTTFYYLTPLIICFPLAISISCKILYPLLSFEFFLHKQKLLHGALFILITLGGMQSYAECHKVLKQNIVSDKTLPFLKGWKNTPLIIVNDGNKVCIEPTMYLAVAYSGKWDSPQYFDFMKKAYPHSYIFTPWLDDVVFWGQKTDISFILKKDKQALIYLSGADPVMESAYLSRICAGQLQKNNRNCEKIYSSQNKYEDIYLLKADTLR